MFKITARCRQLALGATLLAAVLPLFVSTTAMSETSAATQTTDLFLCTPVNVAAFYNRVHVRCSTGAPPNASIFYFAVCTSPDSASASRFLSVFTTARVTGKTMYVHYTSSDTSGTACGCGAGDCRLIYGAEAQ